MTFTPPPDDPLLAALGRHAGFDPDPARARRLRARCHALLDPRGAPELPPPPPEPRPAWRRAAPLLVGGVVVAFLFDVLRRVLAVYGM